MLHLFLPAFVIASFFTVVEYFIIGFFELEAPSSCCFVFEVFVCFVFEADDDDDAGCDKNGIELLGTL